MTTLKIQKIENTGTVYADSSKPDLTVRFKSSKNPKSVSGVSTTNYIQEIIYNDNNPIVVGGTTVKDPISLRIRTSGAIESKARLAKLLASAAAQLEGWSNEDVFVGFAPATAPVILP